MNISAQGKQVGAHLPAEPESTRLPSVRIPSYSQVRKLGERLRHLFISKPVKYAYLAMCDGCFRIASSRCFDLSSTPWGPRKALWQEARFTLISRGIALARHPTFDAEDLSQSSIKGPTAGPTCNSTKPKTVKPQAASCIHNRPKLAKLAPRPGTVKCERLRPGLQSLRAATHKMHPATSAAEGSASSVNGRAGTDGKQPKAKPHRQLKHATANGSPSLSFPSLKH